ncbi:MAG TPA: hypothetical protein VFN67_13765 [Polyangiales bacterium]|nr:hypothetical protein [Polyangiales bacterium]
MSFARLLRWTTCDVGGNYRLCFWLLGPLVLCHSCLVDSDYCDANQVHATPGVLDYCECAPGTVQDPKGFGCKRCAKHEVAKAGKCECAEGFSRSTSSAACEEQEASALGSTCTDNSMCSEPFLYCATDGEQHYCTVQDCDDNCPDRYTCETRSGAKFCAKLPSGIGEACSSNDDCSAFDAAECDTFNKRCVLGGCATGAIKCPSRWNCCDLSVFAPGVSFCAAPDEMCVGKVVTP